MQNLTEEEIIDQIIHEQPTARVSASDDSEAEEVPEDKMPLSITIKSIQDTIRYSETLDDTDVDFVRKLRNLMYRAQEDRRKKTKQIKITDYVKEI